ncbi:MAG: hypothetical protein NVSMB42_19120 [Herpetosiphon sp.]
MTELWWVREIHNFGGFFGGDTVTLTASPAAGGQPTEDEVTLVIDEQVLANVADRHTIAPEMVLAIDQANERVERAVVIAAREWEVLDTALGADPPAAPLAGPQIRAFHCSGCGLWVGGDNNQTHCPVCHLQIPVGQR